jgi:hypothetical protein
VTSSLGVQSSTFTSLPDTSYHMLHA